MLKKFIYVYIILGLFSFIYADNTGYFSQNYTKSIYRIEMRDGAKLFTVVYTPKDTSEKYPILLMRTPYTVAPYDSFTFREDLTNEYLIKEKYIFVLQDVRGRFMSEGEFLDMRPYIKDKKKQ